MNLYQRITNELETSKQAKTYNNIKVLESPQGSEITIDGKPYLNMCSNNYLGFANDPMTVAAFKESADKFGVGPGAVRSISGTFSVHCEFEQRLAEFKGVEAVIVVQSGFQANTGLIPTITTADDLIISDELNHASIIDGVRLSKASRAVYKHCDMEDLRAVLTANVDNIKGNMFIITDGVFSMDGDIAPLDQINKLAKEFGAYTVVDDAHGEGVLGENGRGTVAHFGLEGQIDIEVGTLSKAFGIAGGFIGGKQELIEYLNQKSRVFLFSSGLDMGLCYAGLKIIDELERSDERNKILWENAKYLQEKFTNSGYSIGNTMTPITPFMVGSEEKATILTKLLFDEGILVSPIIYPTVAKGKARIRLMISSLHTKEQLDKTYEAVTRNYESLS
ncbi:glycine C-acetyltransferase [Mollicutes bacterium LVI A0039]|nr:glycine C-acetyltransferase [Mollicutes bacterium LVI A0039]